jgi:hypothetical protein
VEKEEPILKSPVLHILLLASCLGLRLLNGELAHAAAAIHSAMIFDDGRAHADFASEPDPAFIDLAFPFCPTDRLPCDEAKLAWVQLRISVDTYSVLRNDPHDSIARILEVTRNDLAPLAQALTDHFTASQTSSDVARVSFVHGLVQAVNYRQDLETGWTEFPKFGIEFLVDEQGDCDDAAILTTLLLDALSYRSYFVDWDGEPSGHLSTAIDPGQGDLAGVVPPPGSLWVEFPGLPRLLHVDGTGTPGGCGQGSIVCGGLGHNEWHLRGLTLNLVIRPDDPALATRLPLSAWSNGGLDRPNRKFDNDRRESDEEIREEVFDAEARTRRLQQRLEGLGVEKQKVAVYLRRRYPVSREVYYTFLAICLSLTTGLGILTWRRCAERRQRVKEVSARRDAENSWR